jgi:hypothetical protein
MLSPLVDNPGVERLYRPDIVAYKVTLSRVHGPKECTIKGHHSFRKKNRNLFVVKN